MTSPIRSGMDCHNCWLLCCVFGLLFRSRNAVSLSALDPPPRVAIKVFYDSSNNLHRDIQYHPEHSGRIDACLVALKNAFSYSSSNNDNDLTKKLEIIDISQQHPNSSSNKAKEDDGIRHVPFSEEDLTYARSVLVKAHSEEFVMGFERRCRSSRERRMKEGKNPLGFVGYIDADTYLTTESYDVCLRAAAAWICAVNVAIGQYEKDPSDDDIDHSSDGRTITHAMALTRPPGHHATKTLSNGFCVFNFAAAAAIHAMDYLGARVSVLDWDVHYGQGVADILQHHPNSRYVSVHQSPAFPYEGEKRCLIGKYQNVLTVPVPPDSTWTCGYRQVFEDHVLPFVITKSDDENSNDGWEPDLVIVCAGYDALASDELASCNLNAVDYGKMTKLLMERISAVRRTSSGNKHTGIVMGLEGGYQLKDGVNGGNLADAVTETLKALL